MIESAAGGTSGLSGRRRRLARLFARSRRSAVKPEQVTAMAQKYLTKANRTVGRIVPPDPGEEGCDAAAAASAARLRPSGPTGNEASDSPKPRHRASGASKTQPEQRHFAGLSSGTPRRAAQSSMVSPPSALCWHGDVQHRAGDRPKLFHGGPESRGAHPWFLGLQWLAGVGSLLGSWIQRAGGCGGR